MVVCRAFEHGPVVFSVGDPFPYRELGVAFDTLRRLCENGYVRIGNLVALAGRAFDYGDRHFEIGDSVPFMELGIPIATLNGMALSNMIAYSFAEVAPTAPAPKVGGKADRGATARQRSARA